MRQTVKGLKFTVLLLFIVVFTLPSVYSAQSAYYNFSEGSGTTYHDGWNSFDLTANAGAGFSATYPTFNTAGDGADYSADFDGSSSATYTSDIGNWAGDWSVSFWVKRDRHSTAENLFNANWAGGATKRVALYFETTNYLQFYDSSAWDNVMSFGTDTTSWTHIVVVHNNSDDAVRVYANGVLRYNDTYNIVDDNSDKFRMGSFNDAGSANPFDGQIDELKIWSQTLTIQEISDLYDYGNITPGTPSPDYAPEIEEKESFLEQSGTTTINSVNYVSLLSGNVEILNSTWLYGSATIPIINPASSNQADCQIGIDGTELNNSETSRTLTAGQNGNVLLTSFEHYVTPNNYTFSLDCKRTGGGAYSVENSTLYVHVMSNLAGTAINTAQHNITSKAIAGLIDTFNITTTGNSTNTGYTRALVAEWTAEYDYTSTENMSVTLELAGTNCTIVKRYGSSGGLGNVAGACIKTGLTNSTTYDVRIFGNGSGNLENAVFHVKEFVLHTNEINMTSLAGINVVNSTHVSLANHTVTINGGHSTPHLTTEVVVSVLSNNGTAQAGFFLSDGSTNSTTVPRTVGAGQPGVIGIQEHYENVSGTKTLELYGYCDQANCSLTGVSLVSYITNELAITPNSFFVTVNNTYTGTAINEFDINSSGTVYSTTTGSIEVFTTDALVNITHPVTNTSAVPFFENTTINHDTTTNLSIQAVTWTAIYANEPDGSTPVNNYTITWQKQNDTVIGSVSTTSGVAYVPLFNGTYDVNISNAIGDDETAYAIQTAELNASPYLRNYTFPMLISNSINITFYDEETGIALVGTDVTLEYFSSTGTSGNETTNTSVMFINLLLPETYTFIYDAPGYDQRFYEFTLVNETFNNLNLTLLNSTTSSTVTITVKDTLNNPVEDATVKILKFDVSENQYDLIEVRETNFEGQTIAGMILNNPLYKFIIEKEGTVVLSTQGTQIYGTSLTLVVDLIQNTGFEEILTSYKMSGAITYDNSSYEFTFNFNDESNTGTQACLTVYRWSDVKTVYNQTCTSTTSGTLTRTVNNITGRTYQAIGTITDSNGVTHVIDTETIRFADRIQDNGSSLVMMILMIIVFATALAVSVEIAIVGAFAVPLMFNVIGLTTLSISISVTLLVTGIVLAFIIGVIKR